MASIASTKWIREAKGGPSGNILLRLPKSLKAELKAEAEQRGISLNKLINELIIRDMPLTNVELFDIMS